MFDAGAAPYVDDTKARHAWQRLRDRDGRGSRPFYGTAVVLHEVFGTG